MKVSEIKGFEHVTNFDLREFVHPDVWARFGASSIWFLDPALFEIAQRLRNKYGPTTINNWAWGELRVDSGFSPNREIGAAHSQHKYGRAIDAIFQDVSADEVRDDIMQNQKYWMHHGITTLEHKRYAPTWVHIDTRFTNQAEIFIVRP